MSCYIVNRAAAGVVPALEPALRGAAALISAGPSHKFQRARYDPGPAGRIASLDKE
jgi:hypothetical protein